MDKLEIIQAIIVVVCGIVMIVCGTLGLLGF